MTARNAERDECVLNHLGKYGFSLRAIISRCCFEGGNPGNVLKRLSDSGKIVSRSGIGDNRSYYQLTPAEAANRGFPKSSAKIISGDTLERRLAVVWYCTVTKRMRRLLSREELNDAMPDLKSSLPHCIEKLKNKTYLISRLQVVSQKEPAEIARDMLADIKLDQNIKSVKRWLRLECYRYVILADDPSSDKARIKAISQAIAKKRIPRLSRFAVEFAPRSSTLAHALKCIEES